MIGLTYVCLLWLFALCNAGYIAESYGPGNVTGGRHVVLDESVLSGKRVYIIGDVHGCFDELNKLLKKIDALKKSDENVVKKSVIIIIAGDLVNRGPKSCQVLRFVRTNPNVYSIRGNHEDNILREGPAKYPWMLLCPQVEIDHVRSLPYTLELPSYNAYVVHAGLLPDTPLEEQTVFTMTRMRNIKKEWDGTLTPLEATGKGKNWAKYWTGPRNIYYGHDAGRGDNGPQRFPYATGLDTGCYKGQYLTANKIPVENGQFFRVKCPKYANPPVEDDEYQ